MVHAQLGLKNIQDTLDIMWFEDGRVMLPDTFLISTGRGAVFWMRVFGAGRSPPLPETPPVK